MADYSPPDLFLPDHQKKGDISDSDNDEGNTSHPHPHLHPRARKAAQKLNGKHPGGRPTKYTPEIAQSIINQLCEGIFLVQICKAEDIPSRKVIYEWASHDRQFRDDLRRARSEGAENKLMEAQQILEDSQVEAMPKTREILAHTRWVASKMAPADWGDRTQLEISGGLEHRITFTDRAPSWLAGQIGDKPPLTLIGEGKAEDDADPLDVVVEGGE